MTARLSEGPEDITLTRRSGIAKLHSKTLHRPTAVRLVKGLSVAAIKLHLHKEIALWYCLRALNHWGSGRLDQGAAVAALIQHFGFSQSTAYRILANGDNVFWLRRPNRSSGRLQVEIMGLGQVADYFNIYCGKYFVEIPPQHFCGRFRQNAWIYGSYHSPDGTRAFPISRTSIQEATGVSRRSQQRYDPIVTQRTANFANAIVDGRVVPIKVFVDGKSRQWEIHRRLGNTYQSRCQRASRGMLRKLNVSSGWSWQRGGACPKRRFFLSVRSLLRHHYRASESYLLAPMSQRLVPWRAEWLIS